MKLNKYIGIAVMPMLFAACQNDTMEDMQEKNQPIYTLSGIMDKGVNCRAQIQLGNPDESKEIFMWNEGDQFNLYQGGPDTEVTFNISSSYTGNQSSATFSSENPVYPGTYVAVYPTVELDDLNRFIFGLDHELDFSKAVTKEEKDAVWKEYFKNNMYMIARGELTAEGANSLTFEQQCVLVRITYLNMSGSDQVMSSVILCGENQYYTTSRNQNMDFTGWGAGSTNWYEVKLNDLQVAAGESTDIYLFFFPSEFGENGIMEMYFSMPSGDRSVKVPVSEISANNGGAEGFEAGKRYWFEVTATKGGAVLSKHYSTKPIVFENVALAAALQGVLGSDMVTIDEATGYGTMIEADVNGVTQLDFGYGDYQIETLDGIENFKNLTYLNLINSALKECDMSQNTKLTVLYLGENELTSIDLSKNTQLKNLNLGGNENLTSVNLSGCKELQLVHVGSTGLTSLDIPFKGNIWQLGYNPNNLSFNLEDFPGLTTLSIPGTGIESIDFIPATTKAQLTNLHCYSNKLTSIDLAGFTNLEYLDIDGNELTSLDLTKTPRLNTLRCQNNKIQRLDISALENLNNLYCGYQKDDIILILVANENQKNRWRSDWSKWAENYNAYLEGEEPKYIAGSGGNGNDFENGGEF